MKSASCGSNKNPLTALMASTIVNPLMIKDLSSEETQRFAIALKSLHLLPKVHPIQLTKSYPTSGCSLANKECWSEQSSGPNLEEREKQAAGKRAMKSTA